MRISGAVRSKLLCLLQCLGIDVLLYVPVSLLLADLDRNVNWWMFSGSAHYWLYYRLLLLVTLAAGVGLYLLLRLRTADWVDRALAYVLVGLPALYCALYRLPFPALQDPVYALGITPMLTDAGWYISLGGVTLGCLLGRPLFARLRAPAGWGAGKRAAALALLCLGADLLLYGAVTGYGVWSEAVAEARQFPASYNAGEVAGILLMSALCWLVTGLGAALFARLRAPAGKPWLWLLPALLCMLPAAYLALFLPFPEIRVSMPGFKPLLYVYRHLETYNRIGALAAGLLLARGAHALLRLWKARRAPDPEA